MQEALKNKITFLVGFDDVEDIDEFAITIYFINILKLYRLGSTLNVYEEK